jgi:hypothetical protein
MGLGIADAGLATEGLGLWAELIGHRAIFYGPRLFPPHTQVPRP